MKEKYNQWLLKDQRENIIKTNKQKKGELDKRYWHIKRKKNTERYSHRQIDADKSKKENKTSEGYKESKQLA